MIHCRAYQKFLVTVASIANSHGRTVCQGEDRRPSVERREGKNFFCKLPVLPSYNIWIDRVYYHQVKKHKKHKKSKKREHEDGGGEDENVKRSKKDFKEDSIKNGGW